MKLLRLAILLFMLGRVSFSFSQYKTAASPGLLSNTHSIGFIQNTGQVLNMEDGSKAMGVYYVFNSPEATIYITRNGISFVYEKPLTRTTDVAVIPVKDKAQVPAIHYQIERVDATLVNADIDSSRVEVTYADNAAHFNYYSGNTVITNQRLIKKIVFKEVYPGIDWVVYDIIDKEKQKIKYDFVVRKSGKAEDIGIRYSPNVQISQNKDRSLSIISKLGSAREGTPVGFSENNPKKQLQLSYRVKGNHIGFTTPEMIRYPFTIDPDLYWGTMLHSFTPYSGKSSHVAAGNIVTDKDGNIYTYASCSGPMNFPTLDPGNGAYYSDVFSAANGNNVYLKFNEKGVLLWSTYFAIGGNAGCIAVDSKDNLIAASLFSAGTLPLTDNGGYFDATSTSGTYLAKFDDKGHLTWCTKWGTDLTVEDMACDEQDNFYLVGAGYSPQVPKKDPGNGAYIGTGLNTGPYISKFNAACTLVWSTIIQGDARNSGCRLAVDKNRNIYMLNPSASNTNYPLVDAGGYFNTNTDDNAGLTKFDSTLKMVWSTRVITGTDVEVDTSGNVYIAGMFLGIHPFPYTNPGNGAFMDPNPNPNGARGGAAILKFDQSANLVWATTYSAGKSFYFKRLAFEKFRNLVHVYGIMNDNVAGLVTRNDACNGSYYYPSSLPNDYTDPFIVSFTTSCNLTYASLNHFAYQYYEYADMTVDRLGSLLFVFGFLEESNFGTSGSFSALKNPGNGAYYEPVNTINYMSYGSAIMKLTPTTLSVATAFTSPSNCNCTGTISVTPTCGSGTYTYLWSRGDITPSITNVCAGDYTVTITDLNSHSKVIVPFHLPNPPGNISGAVLQNSDDHCSSGMGSISVKTITGGPSPYLVSFNNQAFSTGTTFDHLAAGSYRLAVKDAAGCEYDKTVDINNISGPVKIFSTAGATACDQPTGLLVVDSIKSGTAPFSFSFNNAAPVTTTLFKDLHEGAYTITVKDSAGCSLSDNVIIKKMTGAASAILVTDNSQCGQTSGSVMVTWLSGGAKPFVYSMDNLHYYPDSLFSNLQSGPKYLYVKDSNGCLYEDSLILTFKAYPQIKLPADTILCNNAVFEMDVTQPNASYLWDDGSAAGTRKVTKAGKYTVKVTGTNNCSVNGMVSVTYQATPSVSINRTVSQCVEDTLHMDISFPDAKYLWQDGSTSPLYDISKKGLYSYEVSNYCGSSSGMIDVSTHVCLCTVMVPNVFSPNGDGINDKLVPVFGCLPSSYRFSVYDRNGQPVFDSSDPAALWNGMYNNKPLPVGTYYYILKIKGVSDPVEREKSGSITLIR